MWKSFGIAFLLAGLCAPPSAAAPSAWQSEWEDDTCALVRAPEGTDAPVLAIRGIPGTDPVMVNLEHKRWFGASGPARNVELSLDTGGVVPITAQYIPRNLDRGPTLSLRVPDRAFLRQFASARALTVKQRGRTIATYTLPAAAQAVASFRACQSDLLARWGIDAEPWFRLRSGPVPKQDFAEFVTDADYPREALDAKVSGTVMVRLSVNPAGIPTACVALTPRSLLDRGTCEMYMKRLRFQPALDGDGKPVPAPYVTKIRWLMPS